MSYEKLLDVFWKEHNPTVNATMRGGQYRSAIFYHTPDQEKIAKASKATLEKKLGKTIYTQILPAPVFWRAEEYHQNYYKKNSLGGCRLF